MGACPSTRKRSFPSSAGAGSQALLRRGQLTPVGHVGRVVVGHPVAGLRAAGRRRLRAAHRAGRGPHPPRGHNIDPVVIEEALLSHPAVSHAAAVGRPDRYSGEVPVVYVSLNPSAPASEEELRAWAAGAVPEAAAAPKELHIVDSIPFTDVGKTFTPASGRTRRSGRCRLSRSTAYVCAA